MYGLLVSVFIDYRQTFMNTLMW